MINIKLKTLIHESGFDHQIDLSRPTGLTSCVISGLLRGRIKPTAAHLKALGKVIDRKKLSEALPVDD